METYKAAPPYKENCSCPSCTAQAKLKPWAVSKDKEVPGYKPYFVSTKAMKDAYESLLSPISKYTQMLNNVEVKLSELAGLAGIAKAEPYPPAWAQETKAQTTAEIEALAAKNNCTVIWGAPDTLTLDIDPQKQEGSLAQFERVVKTLTLAVPSLVEVERYVSKSGLGMHIVLRAEGAQWSAPQRIALQTALGSDAYREAYCMGRVTNADLKDPCVLFKPVGELG